MSRSLNGSNARHTDRYFIDDNSQIADSRRNIVLRAGDAGFDADRRNDIGIAVTELSTNLLKHAGGGELLVRADTTGVYVLSLDKGPGRGDIHECLTDGYSTSSSPGTGLGAMQRLSSTFDIYSLKDHGTAIALSFELQPTMKSVKIGALSIPYEGEDVCGDAWEVIEQPDRILMLMIDGIGHGTGAYNAASEGVRIFTANQMRSPIEIIDAIHLALHSTRGAAVMVASLEPEKGLIRVAGIGNCAGTVVRADFRRGLVSMNGTAGHGTIKPKEFTAPWQKDDILILHTDGLQTHWDINPYPGLISKDPALLTGILYRDFTRGRDDVTVLAVQMRS